jgi:two-component system, NtrC family, response regulator AtoC
MPKEPSSRNCRLEKWNPVPSDEVLFGKSAVMAEVRRQAQRICGTIIPVLLTGDGGTGKEALARWIHAHSEYADGEFVKVNCAAIPGTLLESELFGYERGAFTGANYAKPGLVEAAHHGTLFLDEIADLDLNLQSKLLHFLQDGTFSRIGGHTERKIETRLICSTNKDLEKEASAGRFRHDLFYRVHVFRLKMPLLRDRHGDIPVLLDFFREHFQGLFGTRSEAFAPQFVDYLENMPWPGNIRELSNMVARYVLVGPEATVHVGDAYRRGKARFTAGSDGAQMPLKRMARDAIKEMEKNVILETLRANQWNRRKTAKQLKISYRALIYKIHDAGLISRRAVRRAEMQPSVQVQSGS